MNEFGEIVEVRNNEAVVMVRRSSACGKCGACQMSENQEQMLLTIPNPLKGEVGDYVELELASSQVLKASAITYLIPLGALILGVTAGYAFGPRFGLNQELAGSILGLLFTGFSFLGIRAMEPAFKKGHSFSPQMVNLIKVEKKGEQDNGK
jgi:sigma-E factor negative regulatory protein RseC